MALGYESVFRVSVAEIFPGFAQAVADGIERRLAELEHSLQEKSAKGRAARATARKLEWIVARRNNMEF
jgi:hypothetical protein